MQRRSRRPWGLLLGAAASAAFIMAVAWSAAPDAVRVPAMVAGGLLAAALYAGLYRIVRRDHWRW